MKNDIAQISFYQKMYDNKLKWVFLKFFLVVSIVSLSLAVYPHFKNGYYNPVNTEEIFTLIKNLVEVRNEKNIFSAKVQKLENIELYIIHRINTLNCLIANFGYCAADAPTDEEIEAYTTRE